MMNSLITFIEIITSILIGYYIGSKQIKDVEIIPDIIKEKIKLKNSPVGGVMRPDGKTLFKWNNPKEAEEEAEMVRVIENIQNEHK